MYRYIKSAGAVDVAKQAARSAKSGSRSAVKSISNAIHKFFQGFDKLFEKISQWNTSDKTVLDIETEIPDKDNEGQTITFRLLIKCVGRGDGYQVFDYYLKKRGEDSSNMVSLTGKHVDTKSETESNAEYNSRMEAEIDKAVSKLIDKYTRGAYDTYIRITPVQQ